MSYIHIDANYDCAADECFIEAFDHDSTIPNDRRVKLTDVPHNARVIRCRFCEKPARKMDCHWPWMSGACRCEDHSDFEMFPLED